MTATRTTLLWAALAAVLAAAFAFGGGGSRFGLANLAVQLTAFAALAAFPQAVLAFWTKASMPLRLLVAASLLLPLAQLVPLPAGLWSALPGRDLVKGSLDAAAVNAGWTPLSTYPLRTALALSALVTPLAILMLGWHLPRHHLLNLGWLVVGLCLLAFAIGTAQVYSGALLDLWPEGISPRTLLGTFANRNSAGLFLVGGIALAVSLPAPRPHPIVPVIRLALCVVLLTAVILTKSRSALVLSLLPLLLALFHVATSAARRAGDRAGPKGLLIGLAIVGLGVAAVGATVVVAPGRLSDTLERFESSREDPRRFIWEDAAYSATRYWPVGSGMGTFDDVFPVDEALENLGQRPAGRVHNDFIEVTIEAGLPGLVLVASWLVLIAALCWQARRSPDRWAAWGAASFLIAIALQSITDYPLRNQTILATAAVSLLLLARLATDRRKGAL